MWKSRIVLFNRQTQFAVIAIAASLGGCSDKSASEDEPPRIILTPAAMETPSAILPNYEPLPTLPDHNYDERQGETYFYISAVSDEDRKRGIAVGDVYSFSYLGSGLIAAARRLRLLRCRWQT